METEDGVCNNNDLPGVFVDVIDGRRQYTADVRALWSQNETLTSGECSLWHIPDEVFKFQPKDYFACLGQIRRTFCQIKFNIRISLKPFDLIY